MPARRDFDEHDHVIRLRDGRRLGYAEYGDPRGTPLISCHGGLTSRRDVEPADAVAGAHGLRLISPDRPGIGLSSSQPGRSLLDWADDVAELADALALDTFAIMGWSLGGDYAAGCAYALGDRITVAGLIATGIPDQATDLAGEVGRMDRVFISLARRAPALERVAVRAIGVSASRLPGTFRRRVGVPTDAADAFRRAVLEGVHNTRGVVDEYQIIGSQLSFDPAGIAVPVHLWHGDHDEIVPRSWAEAFAERIPHASLTIIPGADHYLWYDHWDEIFTVLARYRT